MIYFIEAPSLEVVKIGFTAKDPQIRFNKLQADCPVRVRLLGWCEGDPADEQRIHAHFSRLRTRGEWFLYASEIKEFVATHTQQRQTRQKYPAGVFGEYFRSYRDTPSALAGRLGKPVSTITRLLKGERGASARLAIEIDRGTEGKIRAEDILRMGIDRAREAAE